MTGVNNVISGGLAWARPQVRAGATLYVLITGYLVLTGRLDRNVLAGRIIRIVAVAALLTSAGTFNTVVRDLFLETIPTSIGSALTGASTTSAPAAQFDAIWNATMRAAAGVLAEATGWTQIGERVAIRLLMAATFIPLVVIFLIWIVCRVVMGMVIALGPFLIGLWLFDATRPFVQRWVGKLVSLTLVQVCTAVLLRLLVEGFTTYLRSVQNNMGAGLDEKIASFLQVAGWYWCGLLLMAGLTTVAYSIGGGLATSFAPVTAGAAHYATAAAGGAGRAGKALAAGAYRMVWR
ncbi:type IV secretion system protein [Roseomonas sp. NAR14]|uniref:Type IV secretion system protein n=2 Tax=Roseomonas acroporae TaxID=2937791 RepID=A0A9X1YBA9_9PROT|nr:type IV secretion system protein [Roseomonas acroporae]MCK8786565.1 type IV secretion system protein [Roseomonas acroporae]